MRILFALAFVGATLGFATTAEAQTAQTEFTLTVEGALTISVDNTTLAVTAGSADLGTNVAFGTTIVTSGGNEAYDVTFLPDADVFVDELDSNTTKAITDLEHDIGQTSTFTALPLSAGTPVLLRDGATGTGNTNPIDWRVAVGAAEEPGIYKGTVIFTIAAQ